MLKNIHVHTWGALNFLDIENDCSLLLASDVFIQDKIFGGFGKMTNSLFLLFASRKLTPF